MTDLAPFVAAVVRDKVVLELQQENAKLREELKSIELGTKVRFTGPSSFPNYAVGSIHDAITTESAEQNTMRKRLVPVVNHGDNDVPLSQSALDLCRTEVWVGNHCAGELVHAYNQAVDRFQGDSGYHYLKFCFLFWERVNYSVETSLEVGPFMPEEAEREFQNCSPLEMPISGLGRVPGVTFKAIELEEPNSVTMD